MRLLQVLDAGKIAEFDSPDALLRNNQSLFYGMAKEAGLLQNKRQPPQQWPFYWKLLGPQSNNNRKHRSFTTVVMVYYILIFFICLGCQNIFLKFSLHATVSRIFQSYLADSYLKTARAKFTLRFQFEEVYFSLIHQ